MDIDKTIVIDQSGMNGPDFGSCPVCNNKLNPVPGGDDMLRCTVCGFIQKQKVVIEPGHIIGGKYRVLNYLSGGGGGDIFFCHPLDNMQVRYVLKVLRDSDSVSRRRFQREAEILSAIQDEDRIARIFDFGEAGDNAYIVMEYIDGKNLRQLKSEFCFDEQTTLQVAREVVVALKHLWEDYSIIHRDIKPENIMLDQYSKIKVLDFGLSKQWVPDSNTSLTMAMTVLGTPGYMSPEQFADSKSVDFRADIFSLGATICYLMSGKKPFNGDSPMEIYHDTLANSPPLTLEFDTGCSAGCMQLIRNMMQRDPDDRYYSYSDLLADIDRLIQ